MLKNASYYVIYDLQGKRHRVARLGMDEFLVEVLPFRANSSSFLRSRRVSVTRYRSAMTTSL